MKLQMAGLLAVFLLVVFACSKKETQSEGFGSANALEFKALIDSADANTLLLDIRTPQEFAQGYIKGAANIDFYAQGFKTKLNELDKEKNYLIYCRSSSRTTQTLKLMKSLGFKKVTQLKSGINSWDANSLPLER